MNRDSNLGAIEGLLRRRYSRRDVIAAGGVVALGSMAGCGSPARASLGFAAIAGSDDDRVIVPEGYLADVLIRWGDPVVAASRPLAVDAVMSGSLLVSDAARAQAQAFGTSCDGIGIIPIDDSRLVLCVNHETPEMSRMFPGWRQALRERRSTEFIRDNPDTVALMRASVGVSILQIERDGDSWVLVSDSPLNRRITADTPIEFAGPAARHPWLGGSEEEDGHGYGTLGNCAAGTTPWGTYLTAEENTNDFFGNAAEARFEPLLGRATARFGMRRGSSTYRWEVVDERFDHARNPAESMKFGWIVEIDPLDPSRAIKKRTALGRLRHEGATVTLDPDGHPVVYLGDDAPFEYFYKFVSDLRYDPDDSSNWDSLLDEGTLYVARINDDGSGEWLSLVYGQGELNEANDFESQADVVLRCREAADLLGATPLDRPEDVAVHPGNGRVYLSCTQGLQRGGTTASAEVSADGAETPQFPSSDAANPRGPNPYGHILEFAEAGADASSTSFSWEVFILAGDPGATGLATEATPGLLEPAEAYYAGQTDALGLSAFAAPDNLGFDADGNLWIVTDGAQPQGNNNGCFVCPTEGPERGRVRQFMSGPIDAEICGCEFSPDGQTLFLSVQHPGGSSPAEDPSSRWPDFGSSQPRSSLIAIRTVDAARTFGS